MLATVAGWTYQNPLTDNSVVPSGWLAQPNDAAIREGLALVPDDTYLVTTNAYAPHLAYRRQLRILMYDPTFDWSAETIFLNLKDLRWPMNCEIYHRYLESATHLGFGALFYKDGVLVIQKGAGDAEQLRNLVDNWLACD
jgi:hypothetical protein